MQEREHEAKRWLTQAKHDLAAAKLLGDRGHHGAACFWCQQTAELASKAILCAVGAKQQPTNSLVQLYRMLRERAPGVGEPPEEILKLEPYYDSARYPSAWPDGTPSGHLGAAESRQGLKIAEEVLRFAESAIHRLLSK